MIFCGCESPRRESDEFGTDLIIAFCERKGETAARAIPRSMAGRNSARRQGIQSGPGQDDAGGNQRPLAPARFLKEWREFAQLQDGPLPSQAARANAIVRQSAELLKFALRDHWLLGPELESLIPLDAGTEHDIFRDPATGRAWKITHPNRWQAKQEPPAEYLKNLQRLNVLAPTLDIRIEGVWREDHEPQLVLSMEWINGEHPTGERFHLEMTRRGWEPIGATSFRHRESGVVIRDAHKDNFILTPEAKLIPIDLSVDPLPQGIGPHFQAKTSATSK
jgi:hypothetical protein